MGKKYYPGFGDVEYPEDANEADIDEAISAFRAKNRAYQIPANSPYIGRIRELATERGLDPDLMFRMVAQESAYNPRATSKVGAGGLFQLMPGTAKELGVTDVYDPEQNIRGGIDYFDKMVKAHGGDVRKALIAYNWGPGNLAKYGEEKMPAETRDYVQRLFVTAPGSAGQPPPQNAPASPVELPAGVKGVGNPRAGQPEKVAEALPEQQYPGEGFVSGMQNVLYRTGRALGLPQALQALDLQVRDPKEVNKEYYEKARDFPGGTTGQIAAEALQAAPVGRAIQGVRALQGSPYLSNVAGAATQAAVTTPGGPEERGKAAFLDSLAALPVTAAARRFSQPFQLRQDVATLRNYGVDAYPPLHIGAESRITRDIGNVTKDLGILGAPQRSSAERFGAEATDLLWDRATPPGMPNLFRQGSGTLHPGDLYTLLNHQFDTAYNGVLRGTRARVGPQELLNMQNVAIGLDPSEARQVQRIFLSDVAHPTGIGTQLGQPGVTPNINITGQDWLTVRNNLNTRIEALRRAEQAGGQEAPSAGRVADALENMRGQWEGHLQIPTSQRHTLQAIDESDKYRRLFINAGASPGAVENVSPSILRQSMQRLTPNKTDIATGRGIGQDVIDPLLRLTPHFGEQAWEAALRKAYPSIATASLGGATLAGAPGAGLALGGLGAFAGLNMASGFQPVARALYGDTAAQRAMARLVRDYPGYMGGLYSSVMRKEKD
jgi:hypothetical protein